MSLSVQEVEIGPGLRRSPGAPSRRSRRGTNLLKELHASSCAVVAEQCQVPGASARAYCADDLLGDFRLGLDR